VVDGRGQVVLPAGSTVKLAMAEFKRAGHLVGRAKIRLRLFSVAVPGGGEVPLDGYPTRIEGGPKPGREGTFHGKHRIIQDFAIETSMVAAGAGAGLAVGGPWGLPAGAAAGLIGAGIYFVARRGPDLVIPAGTVIEFTLDRPAGVELVDPPSRPVTSSSYFQGSSYSTRAQNVDLSSQDGAWGQGLAIPPSADLVALLGQINDPKAVLASLDKIQFRNRPDSDRVFAAYLRGLCDLGLSRPKRAVDELARAYRGAKRLNLPQPAQSEIARNLVVALKASSKNWQENPLMSDPELQAVLVQPVGGE
jgi:hypothetical protein